VAVGDRKSGRLDDVGLDTQTGTKSQHGSRVLGDVWLVEGNPDHKVRSGTWTWARRAEFRKLRKRPATHGDFPAFCPLAGLRLHRKGGTKTALFAPSCFARADAPAHPPPQGFL
jgi:hypothetical protein